MQLQTREHQITRREKPKVLELPVEGTVLVPDIKPDAAAIVRVQARAVLDKADCENGRLMVSGRFLYTVLYRPDASDVAVCAVSGNVPFSGVETAGDFRDDMPVHFYCKTPFYEASVLNSRKFSLRGVVEVTAVPFTHDAVRLMEAEDEGICAQKRNLECFFLATQTQNRIHITERFGVPEGELPVREILLSEACVRDFTVKVVENKAVVKGEMQLSFLYQPEESFAPTAFEKIIELAEIRDLPGISPSQECQFDLRVEEFSAEAVPGDNGQRFDIVADISLLFSEISTEPMVLETMTDGFIPGRETKLTQKELTIQKLLPVVQQPMTIKERMILSHDLDSIGRVLKVMAEPSLEFSGDNASCEVAIEILYQNGNGDLCFFKQSTTQELALEAQKNTVCDGEARVLSLSYVIVDEMSLEVRIDLAVELWGIREEAVSVVTEMELLDEPLPVRPSVVICFVGAGDTLWSIAKRYKITEEEILEANAMTEKTDLIAGQRLLIPKAHAE